MIPYVFSTVIPHPFLSIQQSTVQYGNEKHAGKKKKKKGEVDSADVSGTQGTDKKQTNKQTNGKFVFFFALLFSQTI